MKNILLIVLIMIVVTVSALFFAQNDAMVDIKYFAGTIKWQLNWVLVSFLLVGIFLGVMSVLGSLITTKLKLASANRRLALHEKEIKNLRTLPIKDEY